MKNNSWSGLSRQIKKLSLLQPLSALSALGSALLSLFLGCGIAPLVVYHAMTGVVPENIQTASLLLPVILCAVAFLVMTTASCFALVASGWYYQLFAPARDFRFASWMERQNEGPLSKGLWFAVPLSVWFVLVLWEFPAVTSAVVVLSLTGAASLLITLWRSGELTAFWFGLPLTLVLTLSIQKVEVSRPWVWYVAASVAAASAVYALGKFLRSRPYGSHGAQLTFVWGRSRGALWSDVARRVLVPLGKAASVSAFGCFRSLVGWVWFCVAALLVIDLSEARSRRTGEDYFTEMAVFLLLIAFANAVSVAFSARNMTFFKRAAMALMLLVAILVNFKAVNAIPAAVMRVYGLGAFEARLHVDARSRAWLDQQGVPYRLGEGERPVVIEKATVVSLLGSTSNFVLRGGDGKLVRFTLPSADVRCVPSPATEGRRL